MPSPLSVNVTPDRSAPGLGQRRALGDPGRRDGKGPGLADGKSGADFFTRRLDPERETRRLIAKLEALGHQVSLQPAA